MIISYKAIGQYHSQDINIYTIYWPYSDFLSLIVVCMCMHACVYVSTFIQFYYLCRLKYLEFLWGNYYFFISTTVLLKSKIFFNYQCRLKKKKTIILAVHVTFSSMEITYGFCRYLKISLMFIMTSQLGKLLNLPIDLVTYNALMNIYFTILKFLSSLIVLFQYI